MNEDPAGIPKSYGFDRADQNMIYEAVQYYIKTTGNTDGMELHFQKILNKILANGIYGDGEKYGEVLQNGEVLMAVRPEEMHDRGFRRKYKWELRPEYGYVVSKKDVCKSGFSGWV